MGIHVIRMPDIGEGIAEVELVAWHVKPGDAVVEEQSLADVMTDKANVEIPSPVHGKVLAIAGKPGDIVAVGSELIRIEVEGAGNVKGEAAAGIPPSPSREGRAISPSPLGEGRGEGQSQPALHPSPASSPSPPPSPSGEGEHRSAGAPRARGDKPIASPAVRQHAWDLGIDLRFVAGSGTAGRILHEDVDAYAAGNAASAPSRTPGVERHGEEVVPVIGLRRKIAEKMAESKRHIPHYTYVEEVDVTELEALRRHLNRQHEEARSRLTLLPFLMRAIARAVPEFPEVNARYDDAAGNLTRYGAVHIGIATQTDNGLMVPVVRHAEARDLWSCAAEIARLAEAARTGKAQRDELTGSTITITSLGPLGGIVTTPVVNYPEVAIVGVNRVVERPVIRAGAVVPRLVMNLSSSFDHRIVDGMRAAQFVQALRGFLEAPATLFIE